jgi:hypothetical protein
MSGFKDIAKGGWHPKGKDGKSKESWRGDFKGINQVAGVSTIRLPQFSIPLLALETCLVHILHAQHFPKQPVLLFVLLLLRRARIGKC